MGSEQRDIAKHTRVNDILLGPLERPALAWLAEHAPAWMTPDILTGIGVVGSVMTFAGYALSAVNAGWLWFASLGFLVNWYGDSLDGSLARFRHIQRPKFGFYIDHTVDAVSEFLTIIGIGLSPYLRLDIAAFALIGYMLMSVHVYVRTCVDGVFQISYSKIGPTEMRAIIVIVNTVIFFARDFFTRPLVGDLLPFDLIGIVLAGGMGVAFIVSMLAEASRLAKLGE